MEQNEQNNDWLEKQTMAIPIEIYIKLRLELAEMERKYNDTLSRAWAAESNLADAKEQIRELLGMKEGEDA